MLLRQTATHLVALKRIRVSKYHVKAGLAYSGALLMGVDAGFALLPFFAPHLALAIHTFEATASIGGKCGAAAAGCTVFFDQLLRGVAEESA